MRPTNLGVALASIAGSTDRGWLAQFRTKMVADEANDIVKAIDRRLDELDEVAFRDAISVALRGSTIEERVDEAVAIYEAFLKYKHKGKAVQASRTKSMIKRHGYKKALIRTVVNSDKSSGLELLAKYGRVDCAYEQIMIDFASQFKPEEIAKAIQNLERLSVDDKPEATESAGD
jgi:hypothetical protein